MHALAQLCVRRPVFATMLVLSLVVVGIFSYFSLGVDLFPKVDIPAVAVVVADPELRRGEIETEITKKVEDAVNTISQIDELRSTSSEGQSLVVISFDLSKNGDVAAQEVQNKVNLIIPDLPQTARPPVVQKFDPDATPVLQIAVSAPRSLRDITMIADKQIKQKLQNARGVGQSSMIGGARREIHVLVDPVKLRAYNLTVTDVFNALRQQNLEMPGGSLNGGRSGVHGAHNRARYRSRAIQPDHGGHAERPCGEGQRYRVCRRQLRRTAQRRASGWYSRRHIGGFQAIGRKHRGYRRRSEAALERDFYRAAQGCSGGGDQRPVRVHQSLRRVACGST